jgi:hypothetical protein
MCTVTGQKQQQTACKAQDTTEWIDQPCNCNTSLLMFVTWIWESAHTCVLRATSETVLHDRGPKIHCIGHRIW